MIWEALSTKNSKVNATSNMNDNASKPKQISHFVS